ncbi:response regulator [Salsipaludibacter albus]|uniref:response regulator n=1 Tax=Salsipaludibacter albus TaxID=2849650 RepID=UPI001EE45F0E
MTDAPTPSRARSLRPPLRVVVVDDHDVVRAGLRAGLGDHRVEVVAEADDVASAVDVVRSTSPEVMLLDVRLPGGGGPAVLRELGEDAPPTLAVSASDQRDDVVATVRAGATGYLLKTSSVADIAAAVHAVHEGRPVFSPELAGHLLDLDSGAADGVADPAWESLTDREREVLRLLARGHPYRRIAEDLGVVAKTVETHVRNILRKLQVSNRHEATVWAIDRGFDA